MIRLLASGGQAFTSRELWQLVKPLARQAQSQDAVLIVDDTIQEKPHTDENDLICWHFDHTQQKTVKGFNLLTCLYFSQEVSLPVAFELIQKTQRIVDAKTGQEKRKSAYTKNELYRQMLQTCCHNALPFRTVLNDMWFASAENMCWVKSTLGKEFVMPLKSNRKVAAAARSYEPIEALISEKSPMALIFLEAVPFPLLLTRHVQIDKNGKECVLYLVSSDLNLSFEQVLALYQKWWKVEEYHKSLKQHAALAKSPIRTVVTQTNHVFAAIYNFVKLEQLQIKTKLSHFALRARLYALRARLYANALAAAFGQLRALSLKCPA